MKFQELYTLVNEISQNVISNALQKNQELKYNNPYASKRSDRFEEKAIDRAKAKGRYIQLYPYYHDEGELEVIVKTAKVKKQLVTEVDEYIIMDVDYKYYNEWKNAILYLTLPTEINPIAFYLYFTTDKNVTNPFFNTKIKKYTLKNSTDAKNLAKCVYDETGIRTSWKNYQFEEL